MNADIIEAKRRLPLPKLMECYDLGAHAKKSAPCPWHEDKNHSFSVWPGDVGWRFKCHAGCGCGDEIAFVAMADGLSNNEATKKFLSMAGLEIKTGDGAVNGRNGTMAKSAPVCDWRACVSAVTDADLGRLARWRGYSRATCVWLRENGLIGLVDGCFAFPIHDDAGAVVGAHRRVRDGSWRVTPQGTRQRPLVIGELAAGINVDVFESQWDAIAVLDVYLERGVRDFALVVTRGAANGGSVGRILPPGATVYAWPQNDPPQKRDPKTGQTPAEKWLDAVCRSAGNPVMVVATPRGHKDANDWFKAGITDADFEAAFDAAKPVQIGAPTGPAVTASTIAEPATSGLADEPLFDAYYDAARKEYLVRNPGGRWLSLTAGGFKMRLRKAGISTKTADGERVSAAEEVMLEIQDTRDVRYAGSLAGRDAGFYDEGGVRFLVTDSPHVVAPVPGEWNLLRGLFNGLLGADPDHGDRQLAVLFGWMKCAYEALAARKQQPGQAIVLAGPVECGKSLLQSIVTELLGGRCAKPWRYLSGRTDFNSELFAAEHLALEDEQSTTDIRSRMQLGSSIKGVTVNSVHSCHGKNRDAVNLRPFWRLSISVNADEESLLVLPPITADIADKLILLKCSPPPSPFPTGTPELRASYWRALVAELPAFVFHLTQFQVPSELINQRFGVAHFHHPELLAALEALAPEAKLLELIDRELFRDDETTIWEGTAGELEKLLRRDASDVKFEAQRLLTWQNACGAYLGRIAEKHPDRVAQHRLGIARRWVIRAPRGNSEQLEN